MKISRQVNSILPIGSRRRRIAKRIFLAAKKSAQKDAGKQAISYSEWIKNCEPKVFETRTKGLKYKPLISVVVPCFNTPQKYLIPLVESITSQTYQNWELCLVDASPDEKASVRISTVAKQDKRIKVIKLNANKGISVNTNKGMKEAAGEFVGLLDHDDLLSPHALMEVALALNADRSLDLIYSDEDKISDDGKERQLPFFKPDWSPVLLWGVNYITHFVVVRKTLAEQVKGLRPAFDGAQDYDFLLRITEKTKNIHHIPKILYHWRLADGSTAKLVTEKAYATSAGQTALQEALDRRGISAVASEVPDRPTNYRPRFNFPGKIPKVSIIIPFKDKVDYLKVCVPSILKSSYDNYEIILLSNNSVEQETLEYLEELKTNSKCRVYVWDFPFNYSVINNYGRKQAKGEYLIFLNNDTEVLSEDWIEELVGVASQKDIGAVGPLLLYPDNTIQHAGVILGMGSMAGHVFRRRKPHEWTDFGLALWPRNYIAVTAACLTVKAEKFDQVGGFDESMIVAGSDVALCIRLHEKGYQTVYWPFVRLYHYESVSVGTYDNGIIGDYNKSLEYYTPYLAWKDPYFNKNLDLMNESVGLRSSYE